MVKNGIQLLKDMLIPVSGEEAYFEAVQIVKELCGKGRLDILSDEEYEKCLSAVNKRKQGIPLQYIFGNWDFYGRKFFVGKGVLIPRPETEQLCEICIKHLEKNPGEFIDLCSGSGCIAITLSAQTGEKGFGVELSMDAIPYFEKNIRENNTLNVSLIKGDVLDTATADSFKDGHFSLIVSNPPYITTREMKDLSPEVLCEPYMALWGGDDGLDFYRAIPLIWKRKLKKGGLLAFEIGDTEGNAVTDILSEAGFSYISLIKDIYGNDRIVTGKNI